MPDQNNKKTNKTLWIILGVIGGLLVTLAIVIVLLFAVYMKIVREKKEDALKLQEELTESIEDEMEDEIEDVIEDEVKKVQEGLEEADERDRETADEPAAPSAEEEFETTMRGSWLYYHERAGMYYKTFDGSGKIRCGYVESERMPSETINRVIRAEEDYYEVEVTSEEWQYDFDSDEVTPEQTYVLKMHSDGDHFQHIFYMDNAVGEKVYFVKMGSDFNEGYYDHQNIDLYREAVNRYEFETMPVGPSDPVGTWYTEIYDDLENWAVSYRIELRPDGTAACDGWRNKDQGTYRVLSDNEVQITFDQCMADFPGEGWTKTEGVSYKVYMKINENRAMIRVEGNDGITNLTDGVLLRK